MSEITRGATAPTSFVGHEESVDTAFLDAVLAQLRTRCGDWVVVTPRERAALLDQVVRDTAAVADEWNRAACAAKGLDPSSIDGAEELFSGIGTFVRMARCFERTMSALAEMGTPGLPGPVRQVAGDRVAVRVTPASLTERLLYRGMTAEVWMEPGVTRQSLVATQAAAYRDPVGHAGVALVLGAGNVASLGPRDVLSQLFAEGRVVLLKANPVNEYLVDYWQRAMRALIEPGFLTIVTGGADVGAYLTAHAAVDAVHVTGSDKTFDAIVFGTGETGRANKAADHPRIEKPVTGELGNVSPVMVVPATWSEADLDYQAAHVATMLVNNAGFNCLTPRLLITHAQWPQRARFLDKLEAQLALVPTRRAYYPGARSRFESFLAAHPDAHQLGEADDTRLPWTVVRDVDADDDHEPCLSVEAFCSLLGETSLEADSPAAFVDAAVQLCNERVWGSLSMTILAHPSSLADDVVGPRITEAIGSLRYGSIGVNVWHALSFALSNTVWGAYPGHPRNDIQSGCGLVGNAYLFDRPQKSVVTGEFRSWPTPPWFVTNRNAPTIMRRLFDYEVHPSPRGLISLLAAALRG